MRKIMLIASLLIVSATAQAEQSRDLAPASNETQASKPVEAPKDQAKVDLKSDRSRDARRGNYRDDDRDSRRSVRRHESDEHKARRIAAKYGIYW